jgi:hypothetical protein
LRTAYKSSARKAIQMAALHGSPWAQQQDGALAARFCSIAVRKACMPDQQSPLGCEVPPHRRANTGQGIEQAAMRHFDTALARAFLSSLKCRRTGG